MAALRSPLMSPVLPAAGSRVPVTPVELISPSARRVASTVTPCSVNVQRLLSEQDDAHERKERRRSRLLELQRNNLTSPATPADRRKSVAPGAGAGLLNAQLSEHYSNCIKLSAENKINAKNAFGLHLIDYLSELLSKKDMNNFQVASSTLDASAKIYAGRVDAIHTETYKVLTGLGRSSDRRESEGGGDGAEGAEGDAEGGDPRDNKNKRKRTRKKGTVETNLKNINVKKFDMKFEADPLFQKTSATFDEGGSGGLLLNHLSCLDDTSAIAVDLNTVVTSEEDCAASQQTPLDMTELRELYSGMALEALKICPEFADFSFTNWSKDGDATAQEEASTSVVGKDCERRFDMNAEVEHITTLTDNHGEGDDNHDDDMGLPLDDFTGNEDDDSPPEPEFSASMSGGTTVITIGDSKEAKLVESAMSDLQHGSVSSLISVLASEPSEYSYFSTNILQSWAGPEHWKLKPKSKVVVRKKRKVAGRPRRKPPSSVKVTLQRTIVKVTHPKPSVKETRPTNEKLADKTGEEKEQKKSRKRKEPFKLEYDIEEEALEKSMKKTRAATTLTKRTLTKYSKTRTTLPEDLQCEAQDLLRLSVKPKVMVRLQDPNNDVDDGVENYDYSNDNDKENFVPGLEGDDDVDDHDNMGGTMDFDYSAGDVFSQSQDTNPSQSTQDGLNTTIFKGDNLLEQPHKVAKIEIGYAKTAKKVDVKRLKHSMWNLLCTETSMDVDQNKKDEKIKEEEKKKEDEKKKNDPEPGPSGEGKKVAGEHKFSELVKDLPKTVSKNMAKNLSVPIAFVCLLHLANEKTLKIESDEDMSDLVISQGLKQLLAM